MKEKVVINAMMKSELNKLVASGKVKTTCKLCGRDTPSSEVIGLQGDHVICNNHYGFVKENCSYVE